MDYKELAFELMQNMHKIRQAGPQKQISESMQGEQFVLQFLALNKRSVLPSEISNKMGISSARVAAALNSLERKEMVTRQINTSDRRKILVDLTPKGKAFAEKHHQEAMEIMAGVLGMLGEQDARECVRITGRIAEFASQNKDKIK